MLLGVTAHRDALSRCFLASEFTLFLLIPCIDTRSRVQYLHLRQFRQGMCPGNFLIQRCTIFQRLQIGERIKRVFAERQLHLYLRTRIRIIDTRRPRTIARCISGQFNVLIIIRHHQPVRDVSLVLILFLFPKIRLRHHLAGFRLRRSCRAGSPQGDGHDTTVRVIVGEIAPPVFAAGYAEPAEAKTGGDRHQLVI